MIKRIFMLCLAVLLIMQGAASAKNNEGLPEESRIKVAVEVMDTSRHKEFGTAQSLERFLNDKLVEKNLVTVVDTDVATEDSLSLDVEVVPFDAETVGEILVFDAVELPRASKTPKDFEQTFYKNFDVDYVVRCEVLALGATKVENKTIGMITGIVGGGLSFSGSGSSDRDKTLRRVGTGIGLLGFGSLLDVTKSTALNTVVNMQFISVETGEVVWEQNVTGQATKHHKPNKNYDDAWTQAYMESVENSAKLIAKRVNKYVDKVIVKGKSDKDFTLPKMSFGKVLH